MKNKTLEFFKDEIDSLTSAIIQMEERGLYGIAEDYKKELKELLENNKTLLKELTKDNEVLRK